MKSINYIILFTFVFCSCKKIATEVAEEVVQESFEKTGKSLLTKTSKSLLRKNFLSNIEKKMLKKALYIEAKQLERKCIDDLVEVGASKSLILKAANFDKRYNLKFAEDLISNPSLLKKANINSDEIIAKWSRTRNHVDVNKLQIVNKRFPINARVYAGNTYYFDPDLNKGLAANIKSGIISNEQVKRLNMKYPNGVRFDVKGFPEFKSYACKFKNKEIIVDLGKEFSGTTLDASLAEKVFKGKNPDYKYIVGTWHHIQNSTELVKIPVDIHSFVKHTGSAAIVRYN